MTRRNVVSKISLMSGLVITLAMAVWWSVTAQAAGDKHDAQQGHDVTHLKHIDTQAEVEALKPGDVLAMVCSMCKVVELHHVTKDQSNVEMMTVGHKHTCGDCGGAVTVVGTGKGKGRNEQVKHVCSKCGDDAMFVCATKAGGGEHRHGAGGK